MQSVIYSKTWQVSDKKGLASLLLRLGAVTPWKALGFRQGDKGYALRRRFAAPRTCCSAHTIPPIWIQRFSYGLRFCKPGHKGTHTPCRRLELSIWPLGRSAPNLLHAA